MALDFWNRLQEQAAHRGGPILVLAPMADVTDSAFRQIIAAHGRPDAFYTEFVSCDGLMSAGRERLLRDLQFAEIERPIVGQIFGAKPDNFYEVAKLLQELKFDAIDINMGCPEHTINKQGACAELIRHPELAQEIIAATKEGAGDLPVSVKTRIGYNTVDLEPWTAALLAAKPAVITFHWRTKKEMSKVPAHWELAHIPVEMAKGTGTLIFGNGDVTDLADAKVKALDSGVDGVMLGRAIFGNPWLFANLTEPPDLKEKLATLLEHTKLYWQLYEDQKSFALMKKHYGSYVKGFDGASDLRVKLMTATNPTEVEAIINDWYTTSHE